MKVWLHNYQNIWIIASDVNDLQNITEDNVSTKGKHTYMCHIMDENEIVHWLRDKIPVGKTVEFEL